MYFLQIIYWLSKLLAYYKKQQIERKPGITRQLMPGIEEFFSEVTLLCGMVLDGAVTTDWLCGYSCSWVVG